MKKLLSVLLICIGFSFGHDSTITLGGWGMMTFGRFMNTTDSFKVQDFEREFYTDIHGGIKVIKSVDDGSWVKCPGKLFHTLS